MKKISLIIGLLAIAFVASCGPSSTSGLSQGQAQSGVSSTPEGRSNPASSVGSSKPSQGQKGFYSMGLPNVGNTCFLNSLLKTMAYSKETLVALEVEPVRLPGEDEPTFAARKSFIAALRVVLQAIAAKAEPGPLKVLEPDKINMLIKTFDEMCAQAEANGWQPDFRATFVENDVKKTDKIVLGARKQQDSGEVLPIFRKALGLSDVISVTMGIHDPAQSVKLSSILEGKNFDPNGDREWTFLIEDRDSRDWDKNGHEFVNHARLIIEPLIEIKGKTLQVVSVVVHSGGDNCGHYVRYGYGSGGTWELHNDSSIAPHTGSIESLERGARLVHYELRK